MSEKSRLQELVAIKVAEVIDEYTLVINKGEDDNINEGDRYLLYVFDKEIFDPDTNNSLGELEKVKGTGRITHLQAKMATLSSDMKSPPLRSYRKLPGRSGLLGMYAGLYGQETVEELPQEKIPFTDPKKGDLLKKI